MTGISEVYTGAKSGISLVRSPPSFETAGRIARVRSTTMRTSIRDFNPLKLRTLRSFPHDVYVRLLVFSDIRKI